MLDTMKVYCAIATGQALPNLIPLLQLGAHLLQLLRQPADLLLLGNVLPLADRLGPCDQLLHQRERHAAEAHRSEQ